MSKDASIDPWGWLPPEVPEAMRACLMEPGSLTERLIATRQVFAVEPLLLGESTAHPDEAAALGLDRGAEVTARHVALTLDGVTVVVARSYCRLGCPIWQPILDRGSRSLGFTLFSGEVELSRAALEFCVVTAGHPLFELARQRSAPAAGYPARRCRFILDGAPLYVCEAFLPALERRLAISARSGAEPMASPLRRRT